MVLRSLYSDIMSSFNLCFVVVVVVVFFNYPAVHNQQHREQSFFAKKYTIVKFIKYDFFCCFVVQINDFRYGYSHPFLCFYISPPPRSIPFHLFLARPSGDPPDVFHRRCTAETRCTLNEDVPLTCSGP